MSYDIYRFFFFFFFNDTATTEIYTLSLHDALPIYRGRAEGRWGESAGGAGLQRQPCGRIARRKRKGLGARYDRRRGVLSDHRRNGRMARLGRPARPAALAVPACQERGRIAPQRLGQ